MSVCVCGRAKASPIWHCGNICEYVRASEQRLVRFGALVPQVLPLLREASSKSVNFSDLREWSEIPYESVNVYFSSAERSDIDEKCFLVHHIWPSISKKQALGEIFRNRFFCGFSIYMHRGTWRPKIKVILWIIMTQQVSKHGVLIDL